VDKAPKNCQTISHKIDYMPQIDKKQPARLLEIFPLLLGYHQEFMLDNTRRRSANSHKVQHEMLTYLIYIKRSIFI